MSSIEITKTNFQAEVVESDVPVLLDLWAAWCGPCRMVSPIVDEIAGDYAGRIKVGKVDVDAEPELAGAFGVSSDPHAAPAQGRPDRGARRRRPPQGPARRGAATWTRTSTRCGADAQ